MGRRSLAIAVVAASLVPLAPVEDAAAVGAPAMIAVLDAPDDGVDGPAFAATLDAYVAPIGAHSLVVAISTRPRDHAAWLALAEREGVDRGALAVLWFESSPQAPGAVDVYLVLLDRESGGVVVLPIALGAREGRAAHRVLAATSRMILDTEVIERLRASAEIQKREAIPDPWPRPDDDGTIPRAPAAAPVARRTVDVSGGYLGELRVRDDATLHGARVGLALRLHPRFGILVDAGYLTRPEDRMADVVYREHRAPIRLGLGAFRAIGVFELHAHATWLVESVWIRGESRDGARPPIESTPRLDTGGALDLSARMPLYRALGAFAGLGIAFMTVSYRYERYGEEGFTAGLVRFSWTAGIDWRGL
jgi:hypothetical protein